MDSLPTEFVDELHALWEARNTATATTTPAPNGEKPKLTEDQLKAKGAAARAKGEAAKQRLLH